MRMRASVDDGYDAPDVDDDVDGYAKVAVVVFDDGLLKSQPHLDGC